MKKILLLAFLFVLSILPSIAIDWIPNNNNTFFYDKDSIREDEFGVCSVNLKQATKDDKEVIAKLLINCKTKRFNLSESVLYDPKKQRNLYRQTLEPSWDPIPKGSNIDSIYCQICH